MSKMPGALALSSVFSAQRKPREDDERLLDLYWNRAQLKKEYAAMRKERFKLLDSLTEKEGKNARLKQKLEYLEDLLTDSESAGNSIAYYTLRKLWRSNSERLLGLGQELKKQQEASASRKLRLDWQKRIQGETNILNANAATIRSRMDGLNSQRNMLSVDLSEATGIFRFLRRRRLREEMEGILASLSAAETDLDVVRARLVLLENKVCPDFECLDVMTRRQLNFMVLAMAQNLAEHYSAAGILDLARTALEKSVGSARFGSRENCDLIVKKIEKLRRAFTSAESDASFVNKLRADSHAIGQIAQFHKDTDTVPLPGSLNGLGLNVLAQDIWGVSTAMLS